MTLHQLLIGARERWLMLVVAGAIAACPLPARAFSDAVPVAPAGASIC
jgi:hypothetical protein